MDAVIETDDFSVESHGQPDAGIIQEPAEQMDAPAPAADAAPEAVTAADASDEANDAARDEKGRFKPSRRDWQTRVDRVTWEREEARREAAALRSQLELAQAHREPAARPQTPPTSAAPGTRQKPTEDMIGEVYQSYADFAEDLADWKFETRMAERDAQQQQAAHARQQAQAAESYTQKVEAFAKQTPDFHAALDRVNHIYVTDAPAVVDAILGSERGPELSYYLATHPEEYAQLVAQSKGLPANAAPVVRQLLETKLSVAATPVSAPRPGISAAKPPIKTVGSAPTASDPLDVPDDLPIEEHIKRMNARDRQKRSNSF